MFLKQCIWWHNITDWNRFFKSNHKWFFFNFSVSTRNLRLIFYPMDDLSIIKRTDGSDYEMGAHKFQNNWPIIPLFLQISQDPWLINYSYLIWYLFFYYPRYPTVLMWLIGPEFKEKQKTRTVQFLLSSKMIFTCVIEWLHDFSHFFDQ